MTALTIKCDLSGVNRMVEFLQDEAEKAVRPAAQAAAQVLYDEVKSNVAKIGKKSGNLERSIYQVYAKKSSNELRATYQISWNKQTAPHGRLLEHGWMQRYKVYLKGGQWYTAVRPGMSKKNKPKRNASQAAKDAYYVPLVSPKQHPGFAFIRRAMDKSGEAAIAAEAEFLKRMTGV